MNTDNATGLRRRRSKPLYVLLASAMLALIVMPIAFAGAADKPQNANVKKQLRQLKQRIAALEVKKAPTALPPSGPAGGDLAGTYPNPLIKANAVGSGQLAAGAVTTPKIADGAVGGGQIADGGVQAIDLGLDSVGSFALKGLIATVGDGVVVNSGAAGTATVTCPENRMVIGGGYAWSDKETNSIIASAPSEGDPNQTWVVEGMAMGGSSNTLYAWANCLLF